MQFSWKTANRFLPHILFLGIGIGTANYIMNGGLNWIQWIILSLSTCFIIGYGLVVAAANRPWLASQLHPSWKLYSCLFIGFFLLGVTATEIEHLVNNLVLSSEPFQPFSDAKMNLYNGIIALVLGFSFFLSPQLFPRETPAEVQNKKPEAATVELRPLTQVPVKQSELISLIPTQDIVYFEAFDNYAFLFDLQGNKKLCDYSLRFLQERLDPSFLRVHRKYIINSHHLQHIKPYGNGRYQLEFTPAKLAPIISSKSYLASIRTLIKIQ